MFMQKAERIRLILLLVIAVVLTGAPWTMAGAAQLIITCPQGPAACPAGTYDLGGFAVDNTGNVTIALDNAPYAGAIAGTVDPLPPTPDVTIYLKKTGLATGLSDMFYTPVDDGTGKGTYSFPNLPDGNYVVTIDAPGCQFLPSYHKVKILNGSVSAIDGVQGSGPVNFGYAPGPVAGVCGGSANQTLAAKPTTDLCQDASLPTVGGTGPWTWTCQGSNGGANAGCSANKQGVPVNGACGASNGASFATAPSTNLCSTGTATSVSGSGPWTWSCQGSSGGTTSSCSASKSVTPPAGLLDLGAIYPHTTNVTVNAGGAVYYQFDTEAASTRIRLNMTTTDWTGDLDLMSSNVKSPTCDQFPARGVTVPGLWYSAVVGTTNEAISMNIVSPAGTIVYVTVCNRTAKAAGGKLYWSTISQ